LSRRSRLVKPCTACWPLMRATKSWLSCCRTCKNAEFWTGRVREAGHEPGAAQGATSHLGWPCRGERGLWKRDLRQASPTAGLSTQANFTPVFRPGSDSIVFKHLSTRIVVVSVSPLGLRLHDLPVGPAERHLWGLGARPLVAGRFLGARPLRAANGPHRILSAGPGGGILGPVLAGPYLAPASFSALRRSLARGASSDCGKWSRRYWRRARARLCCLSSRRTSASL